MPSKDQYQLAQSQNHANIPRVTLPPLNTLTDISRSRESELSSRYGDRPRSHEMAMPRSESESALTSRLPFRRSYDLDDEYRRGEYDNRASGKDHFGYPRPPRYGYDDNLDYQPHRYSRERFTPTGGYERMSRPSEVCEFGSIAIDRRYDARRTEYNLDMTNFHLHNRRYDDPHEIPMSLLRHTERPVFTQGTNSPLNQNKMSLHPLRLRETRVGNAAENTKEATPLDHPTQEFGYALRGTYWTGEHAESRPPAKYHSSSHLDGHYSWPYLQPLPRYSDSSHNPPAHPRSSSALNTTALQDNKTTSMSSPQPYESKYVSMPESKKRTDMAESSAVGSRPSQPKYTKTTKATNRANNNVNHVCQACQATTTPEWRKGPTGPRTLCNACGLLYAKMCRKREQDAVAAAVAAGRDPADARKELAEELMHPERREDILESLRGGVRAVASVKQHRTSANVGGKTQASVSPPKTLE